jgi:hypothetical protein
VSKDNSILADCGLIPYTVLERNFKKPGGSVVRTAAAIKLKLPANPPRAHRNLTVAQAEALAIAWTTPAK